MKKKGLVIILSDIYMVTDTPIARYRREVHEKYLATILADIIAYANQIQEVILLGDILGFSLFHPDKWPRKIDDIIDANLNILGPDGKLRQVLDALQGRVVYIPGDYDRILTLAELNKIKSHGGYTMKYHLGPYIPLYDTGILFTHGNELTLNLYEHVKKMRFYKPSIGLYDLSTSVYHSLEISDSLASGIQSYCNEIETTQNITKPDSRFTFGWSVFDASLEFWQIMQMGVLSKARELGINVIKHDEKSSTVEMIAGSIDLISKGIDALLISPFNPEVLPFIVADAAKNQIPVVALDIGTGGADVAAFIVSDSFGGGIYAGEYALTLIKKYSLESKNTAIIKVQKTAKYALLRGEGFKRVMLENGYQVIAEISAESEEVRAYETMKYILAGYENDLAVVFCENGTMTLGAAKAIDEAGKKGKIMLIGFDSGPSIIAGIKNGSIQGTIAQEPFLMGETGVEIANSVLLGIPVTYDDSSQKIILMEVYLINENGEALRSIP